MADVGCVSAVQSKQAGLSAFHVNVGWLTSRIIHTRWRCITSLHLQFTRSHLPFFFLIFSLFYTYTQVCGEREKRETREKMSSIVSFIICIMMMMLMTAQAFLLPSGLLSGRHTGVSKQRQSVSSAPQSCISRYGLVVDLWESEVSILWLEKQIIDAMSNDYLWTSVSLSITTCSLAYHLPLFASTQTSFSSIIHEFIIWWGAYVSIWGECCFGNRYGSSGEGSLHIHIGTSSPLENRQCILMFNTPHDRN